MVKVEHPEVDAGHTMVSHSPPSGGKPKLLYLWVDRFRTITSSIGSVVAAALSRNTDLRQYHLPEVNVLPSDHRPIDC